MSVFTCYGPAGAGSFTTRDAEEAAEASRAGYRVTAVTGTEPKTADIYV